MRRKGEEETELAPGKFAHNLMRNGWTYKFETSELGRFSKKSKTIQMNWNIKNGAKQADKKWKWWIDKGAKWTLRVFICSFFLTFSSNWFRYHLSLLPNSRPSCVLHLCTFLAQFPSLLFLWALFHLQFPFFTFFSKYCPVCLCVWPMLLFRSVATCISSSSLASIFRNSQLVLHIHLITANFSAFLISSILQCFITNHSLPFLPYLDSPILPSCSSAYFHFAFGILHFPPSLVSIPPFVAMMSRSCLIAQAFSIIQWSAAKQLAIVVTSR